MPKKYTRNDLRGFDQESQDLILEAQRKGARIRVSSRNHAIVYGPQGGTAAIPRSMKSHSRSAQNTRAEMVRLFAKEE